METEAGLKSQIANTYHRTLELVLNDKYYLDT